MRVFSTSLCKWLIPLLFLQVSGCNSGPVSSDHHFKVLPCIMNSNSDIEKHKGWSELIMEDLVKHEVCAASCGVLSENMGLLKLLVLKRYLVGEGSHRRLVSSFKVGIQGESMSILPIHSCEALFVESLPCGVFADPFELEHLLQCGFFKDAAVYGDTDLELPTILSNRSFVEIHMDVDTSILRKWNELKIDVELPLHARYPPLEEGGYVKVEFGRPHIFLRCNLELESRNQSCLLKLSEGNSETSTDAVVWEVPSGMKAHAEAVSIVTFISASLSVILIIVTSICYSDTKLHKV